MRVEGVWFKHPYVAPTGGTQVTGLEAVNPAWHLSEGHWPVGALNETIVGSAVARRNGWKAGSEINVLGAPFLVAGVLMTGDEADDRVFLPAGARAEFICPAWSGGSDRCGRAYQAGG